MLSEEVATAVWTRALAAPGVGRIDRPGFLAHVERHHARLTLDALADVDIEALALAFGCAAQEPHALAHFLSVTLRKVERSISRVAPADAEDVQQKLLEHLVVGRKLLEFSGRSPLTAWVRVVATRLALDLTPRRDTAGLDETVLDSLIDDGPQPEHGAARAAVRGPFRAAFRSSFERLTDRERAVLRSHYVDGLTTEQLGRLYGVHRITVTRWLVAARQALLEALGAELQARLQLGPGELESLLRFAHRELGRSLSGLG